MARPLHFARDGNRTVLSVTEQDAIDVHYGQRIIGYRFVGVPLVMVCFFYF